jgi:hypothetical protein
MGVERTSIVSDNQNMRRLALSAIGGVVIPLAYAWVVVWLSRVFEESPFSIVVAAPIEWPYWIYSQFFDPKPKGPSPFIPLGLQLALYLGNFLLYTLLTYIVLWWRAKSRPNVASNTN